MFTYHGHIREQIQSISIHILFKQKTWFEHFWTWRLQRTEDPMKPMRLSNFGSLKAQFRAKWFKPQLDRWSKKKVRQRLVLLTKSLPGLVNVNKKIWNDPPILLGKSTIATGSCSIATLNYQRLSSFVFFKQPHGFNNNISCGAHHQLIQVPVVKWSPIVFFLPRNIQLHSDGHAAVLAGKHTWWLVNPQERTWAPKVGHLSTSKTTECSAWR